MPYPTKKLGEIIFENGKSKIKVRDANTKGKYIFFTSGLKTLFYDEKITDGENIILATGGKAIVQYYNGEIAYSTDAYSIKGSKDINTKFLFFFLLLNIKFIDEKLFSGAGIRHLQKKELKNIPIPLPPLLTQKLIVQKLDSSFKNIDESIEITKRNIENIEGLNKSSLHKIINELKDEKIELGKIITFNYGKGVKKEDKDENGKIDVYGANGVMYKTNNYLFEGKSIIVGRKGSAGALNKVSGKFWASDVTYYITINNKIDIDFVFNVLTFLNIQRFARGVKPGINRNDIYKLKIPLPPLEKQKEIVEYLDKVFEKNRVIKEGYEEKLRCLEEMRQSVLREAFEGRLVKD